MSRPSARSSCDAGGRLGQLERLLQPLGGGAGAQRRVAPAARDRAPAARPPEAVGERGARQRRELAQRADPEALERLGQRRRLRPGGAAARPAAAPGRRASAGGRGRRDSGRRARARPAAASAAKRDGAAPEARRRAAAPGARRPARPRASRRAAAQAARLENHACPGGRTRRPRRCPPGARSAASHASATPAGSGGTSRSVGQRASASPSRSPARTPKASAAAEASPMRCSRPGSGASATGPAASTSRPPAATASSKRGSRTQTIKANTCSHQWSRGQAPACASREPGSRTHLQWSHPSGDPESQRSATWRRGRNRIHGVPDRGDVGRIRHVTHGSPLLRAFRSRPVSRILSMSSHPSERPTWTSAGNLQTVLLGLASGGVYQAAASPRRRCALTAPFHPCRPETADAAPDVGGVISVALSRGFPRVGVTDHPAL